MRLEGGMGFLLAVLFAITLISHMVTAEAQRERVVSIPPPPRATGSWGGSWSCWGDRLCDKKRVRRPVSPPRAIRKKGR
ncbi:unnamed protein product [Lactuca virosa]|uniref:Uncharacterized protein n=1 Tax=Lactuca virosa TaxID=75947 RepID=A0AAU9MUY6_9ASTR|nr:unnamed protein product [Lactuca virosa]